MKTLEFKIINDNFDSNLWNKVSPHPLQTWEWGEIKKKSVSEIIRIGEFEGQKLKKVYLLTIHNIPFIGLKIAYLGMSDIPSKDAIDFFIKLGKQKKWVFLKIEPESYLNNDDLDLSSNNIVKSKYPIFYKYTHILDISLNEEEIQKKISKKSRYSIRYAQKSGVIVKIDNSKEGFETFYKLYKETANRQKYFGHSYEYHKKIWEQFKNKYIYILIAYLKDKPIAAIELFSHNKKLYYPYAGNDSDYKKYMPNNLLIWEAILLGKKIGNKEFDLWGINSPDSTNKAWDGFTSFKQSFGGQDKNLLGSFDLIINKYFYQIYNILFYLRKKIYDIKRKF